MSYPADLKYTKDHEWVRVEGDAVTVGITHFAQDALGEVVFVDLPELGSQLSAGDSAAEVESTKSVSDIYSPVSGEVIAVNADFEDEDKLSQVNEDPYGGGWMFKIRLSDAGELRGLMDVATYRDHLEHQDH